MKKIIIYDRTIDLTSLDKFVFDQDDEVFLFSLTSQSSVTETILNNLQNQKIKTKIIPTAKLINESAIKLRQKYIDFIGTLSQYQVSEKENIRQYFAIDEDVSSWWLSLVSEKNTFKSDSINLFVQSHAVFKAVEFYNIDSIIWWACSPQIEHCLEEFTKKNSKQLIKIKTIDRSSLRRKVRNYQKYFYIKHLFWLGFYFINDVLQVKKIRNAVNSVSRVKDEENRLMVVTPYPRVDLQAAEKGEFTNKFYGNLQRYMKDSGIPCVWVGIYCETVDLSFKAAMKYVDQFSRKGEDIFFPEEFITLKDQLKVLWHVIKDGIKFLRIQNQIKDKYVFDGVNYYVLFQDEWFSSFGGVQGYRGQIFYKMFRNLLQNVKAQKCLFYCEMQDWEKALTLAAKSLQLQSPILAYQHATVSKMLLNFFYSQEEIGLSGSYDIARPSKIICNGRQTYDYMRNCGWNESHLDVAEAVCFEHLRNNLKNTNKNKKDILLLAFSISDKESSSLFSVVYDAFKNHPDIEVWIKPHPFQKCDYVLSLLGLNRDTCPFRIVNQPIENLLDEVRIVVVGESSVSLQALLCGCDLVLVNVPEWLNMSPVYNLGLANVHQVSSSLELREKVKNIFSLPYAAHGNQSEVDQLINQFFCFDQKSDEPKKFLSLLEI